MTTPKTPNGRRDGGIKKIIDELNGKYNFQLPDRNGAPWSPSEIPNRDRIEERILSHIKFLYFKNGDINGAIQNLDEYAKGLISNWVYKPDQDPDVIPGQQSKGKERLSVGGFLRTPQTSSNLVQELRRYFLEQLVSETALLRTKFEISKDGLDENAGPTPWRLKPDVPPATEAGPSRPVNYNICEEPSHVTNPHTRDYRSLYEDNAAQPSMVCGSKNVLIDHPDPRHPPRTLSEKTEWGRSKWSSADATIYSSFGEDEISPENSSDTESYLTTPSRPLSPTEEVALRRSQRSQRAQNGESPMLFTRSVDHVPMPSLTDEINLHKRPLCDNGNEPYSRKSPRNATVEKFPRSIQVNEYRPEMIDLGSALVRRPSPRKRSVTGRQISKINFNSTTTASRTSAFSVTNSMSTVPTEIDISFNSSDQRHQLAEEEENFEKAVWNSKARDCEANAWLHADSVSQYASSVLTEDLLVSEMQMNDASSRSSNLSRPLRDVHLNEVPTADRSNDAIRLSNEDIFGAEPPEYLSSAPFRVRYEVHRFMLHGDLRLPDDATIPFNDYESLWNWLVLNAQAQGKSWPERSPRDAWDEAGRMFDQVALTGDLTFNRSTNGPLFHFRLKPMKIELSSRLLRRFGNDRFLILGLPSFSRSDIPQHLSKEKDALREKVVDWLVNQQHQIMGRTYQAFFVRDKGTRKKKLQEGPSDEAKFLVYLFAMDGYGFDLTHQMISAKGEKPDSHTKMSVEGLWNWFLPATVNKSMGIHKAFARMNLGLSKTYPTIVFSPSQVRKYVPDQLSTLPSTETGTGRVYHKVMNDGCGKLSKAAAWIISERLGLQGVFPSAFQGRIAGAKGLWFCDVEEKASVLSERNGGDIWIELTVSQTKFAEDESCIEEDKLTFEVHDWSKPLASASLNIQLIPILEERGVPREVLAGYLERGLRRQLDEQVTSMNDPLSFRKWIHEAYRVLDTRIDGKADGVSWCGAIPAFPAEKMVWCVENGFDPKQCSFFSDIVQKQVKEDCDRLQQKLNIEVGQSCYAFCVCDPLGVLKEGEVHIGFSTSFKDPVSMFQDTLLHNVDVLVARLPAHLPSDIQKVRAVFKPELRGLKDVIVFSAMGQTPLAEMLSGGDYDGDRPWICWDPAIVGRFQNAPLPADQPTLKELGIAKESTSISDLSLTHRDFFQQFLIKNFLFSIEPSLLGMCTVFHEHMCYERGSMNTSDSITVATLLGFLIDRPKQGIVFTEDDWRSIRARLEIGKEPRRPAYKDPNNNRPTNHILDYLVLGIARKMIKGVLGDFSRQFGEVTTFDSDLVSLYKSVQSRSEQRDDAELRKILVRLVQDIEKVRQAWNTLILSSNNGGGSSFSSTSPSKSPLKSTSSRSFEGSDNFTACVEKCRSQFLGILPPSDSTHPLALHWRQDAGPGGSNLSDWRLLRASAAFAKHHRSKFVWYVAGRELGMIKAMVVSRGAVTSARLERQEMCVDSGPAVVLPSLHASYKPDKRYIGRATEWRKDWT
ncbi:hypothetical protein L228DRAFT_285105 [Xylona heveae TC161]|uniref:RDRP core domain-containing protein n=1 Tax=Xylona heveae (strain CBS 132557 / TC161) TaxID=1328760 RepID=A0A165AFM1_XYLHT|nr:hypothetical protein L228DRAFT_285105 [Xylona heveae TC161]KZF20397.1 hypothetical protein L228DRAFT_285105 [Xylona heveae TC161]